MSPPGLLFATPDYRHSGYKPFMDRATAQAAIRFGFGLGPNDQTSGDARGWLKMQLTGDDPGLLSGQFAALGSGADAADALIADNADRKAALAAGMTLDQANKTIKLRTRAMLAADSAAQTGFAIATPAPFRERLVWFWANHFSTSIEQNDAGPFIGPMIREAIRPNVTGQFSDMVLAVERHPAMLRYLANVNSIGPNSPAGLRSHRGLNENLGRECMELHTVSLAAGYSQTDVTNMAKLLTGWSNAPRDKGGDQTGFLYRPETHEPGPQTVLGRSFDGGEQAGINALTYLSQYPTTYKFLATKLVTHFVADNPNPRDVAHVARVLSETGGNLGAAADALIDLPGAWVPGTKLKTPFDYVISALRAAPPPPPDDPHSINVQGVLNGLGQPLWNAPLPNGWPDQAASWAGSSAVLSRIDWAYTYAGRVEQGPNGAQPADIAHAALGPLLRPATATAIAGAGSRREALTLLFASPEFQRR
jgi:uncharacterized protein (DUF1800 family)